MIKSTVGFGFVLLALIGCKTEIKPVSHNRFSNPKLERIYQLQDKQETRKLIPLLKSKKTKHREAAALAFASIQDSSAVRFLRESMLTDSKPEVRKAAAYSIGQMRDSANVGMLFMALENEIDPESRKYILEALGKSANNAVVKYFNTFNTTVTQLREGHARGMCRSAYGKKYGDQYAKQCVRYFDAVSSDETKLFAAWTLARLPSKYTALYLDTIEAIGNRLKDKELKRVLGTISMSKTFQRDESKTWTEIVATMPTYAKNPYQLVKDLFDVDVNATGAIDSFINWTFNHRYQVVRTASAELCFDYFNLGHDKKIGPRYFEYVENCIASRDMGVQSAAFIEIKDHPNARWKEIVTTYRDSLVLPRQLETFIDAEKALAAMDSVKYVKPKFTHNHPIDWNYVKQVPHNQQVEITTNKGKIVIELKVDDAPGSVSNFLKKVDESFYNGKFFHRVVPNFVIQAGCYRGDGWGAPDWTQRSEFSNYLRYTTGAVGLASVGTHTEGVQFFITHNPTPFLDGRYTIFGYVVEGMPVVHDIEMGDKIIEIKKIKPQQ